MIKMIAKLLTVLNSDAEPSHITVAMGGKLKGLQDRMNRRVKEVGASGGGKL